MEHRISADHRPSEARDHIITRKPPGKPAVFSSIPFVLRRYYTYTRITESGRVAHTCVPLQFSGFVAIWGCCVHLHVCKATRSPRVTTVLCRSWVLAAAVVRAWGAAQAPATTSVGCGNFVGCGLVACLRRAFAKFATAGQSFLALSPRINTNFVLCIRRIIQTARCPTAVHTRTQIRSRAPKLLSTAVEIGSIEEK